MTREEALTELNTFKIGAKSELGENALDMAIKALEQEPCEDEYIKVPKKALKYRTAGMIAYNAEWLKNHFDMERAVICGEQEPCEMTAEEYRQRMIQAFHNADTDELIAICVLPTEKEFEHLEWLLKNHYKKEPCEDAISKQAVLNILDDMVKDYINENDFDKAQGIAWVKVQKLTSVSSSENPNKWIPLIKRPMTDEERECYRVLSDIKEGMIFDCPLPEGGQDVLVYHSGYVSVDTFYTYDGWCDFGSACIDDVQAWMPLPKPYKAESEEV